MARSGYDFPTPVYAFFFFLVYTFVYCDVRTCLYFFFLVHTFVYCDDARTCNDLKLTVFVWETMCCINACQQNVNE
jgi:hypothetical protein